jgi:hypothetical protein
MRSENLATLLERVLHRALVQQAWPRPAHDVSIEMKK